MMAGTAACIGFIIGGSDFWQIPAFCLGIQIIHGLQKTLFRRTVFFWFLPNIGQRIPVSLRVILKISKRFARIGGKNGGGGFKSLGLIIGIIFKHIPHINIFWHHIFKSRRTVIGNIALPAAFCGLPAARCQHQNGRRQPQREKPHKIPFFP